MEITIRKADAADLDAVVRVYEHVHDAEEAGPAQVGWVRGVYPVRSTAEAALERGDLFVEEGGRRRGGYRHLQPASGGRLRGRSVAVRRAG